MCHGANMSIKNFFKKLVQIQSPRIQCCLCAFSVFSALFGMFMVSAGLCLILNYNFMEVDTSGLPSHLHNEEGKKVVGIILLCVGIGSMGLSALVSVLYFTACLHGGSSQTVGPEDGRRESERALQNGQAAKAGHASGNGAAPGGRGSPVQSSGGHGSRRTSSSSSLRRAAMTSGAMRAGSLPTLGKDGPSYSRAMHGAHAHTPPSSRTHHGQKSRHSKKALRHAHHSRFQNPLTSHPEEEEQSLNESRRSASGRRRSISRSPERTRGAHVNYGAELDDDSVLVRDPSGSSESSSAAPPVTITVDKSHLQQQQQDASSDGSYSENSVESGAQDRETTQLSDTAAQHVDSVNNVVYKVSPYDKNSGDLDEFDSKVMDKGIEGEGESEESGRGSQSTGSLDDSVTGTEGDDETRKRLDDHMDRLIQ